MRRWVCVLLAATLVGCGGDDGTAAPEPTTVAPSTTAGQMTVRQAASVVSRHDLDLRDALAALDECLMAERLEPGGCASEPEIIGMLTATLQVRTADIELGRGFDGPVDPEVAGLVDELRSAVSGLSEAMGGCPPDCDEAALLAASRALDEALDAWRPYMG